MPLRNPRQALATSKFMHIGGRPSAWCTATAAAGSRGARLPGLSTSSPARAGSPPASASALAPAMAAASAKPTSRGHHRRSVIPARFSNRPGRSPSPRWAGASRSSSSAEVTTCGASTPQTDNTVVFAYRWVALPLMNCLSWPLTCPRGYHASGRPTVPGRAARLLYFPPVPGSHVVPQHCGPAPTEHGLGHRHRPPHRTDVVHAHDPCPRQHAEHHRPQGALRDVGPREIEGLLQEVLVRDRREQG